MSFSQINPAINEARGVIKILSGEEQARAIKAYWNSGCKNLKSWLDFPGALHFPDPGPALSPKNPSGPGHVYASYSSEAGG